MKKRRLYYKVLKAFEEASTCGRVKVSSVIVKNGRIISTGWNGVPSGKKHCEDHFSESGFDVSMSYMKEEHHKFAKRNEIHAEQNSIAYAARNGISTNGAQLYTSWSPCTECAKLICAAGISKVYYLEEYDRETAGIAFLEDNGISVIQMEKINEYEA